MAAQTALRKETLSRLRRRNSYDFDTPAAVDVQLGVLSTHLPNVTPDGHFVSKIDLDHEELLVEPGASRSLRIES